MEPRHQLGLGLGQVEGRAVGLGEGRDHEDHERNRLREHEPARDRDGTQVMEAGLRFHDVHHRQRSREQQHADRGEAHRQLVRDHLRSGAEAPEQRILVVRGPARERDRVDAQARHGEEQEQPDVDVGDEKVGPDRDHRERDQRRHDGQHRREVEDDHVRSGRDELLLEEQLRDVGDGLQQPQRSHAVGPRARLHVACDLALGVDHVGDDAQNALQDHENLDQRPEHELEVGVRPQRGGCAHASTSSARAALRAATRSPAPAAEPRRLSSTPGNA